MATINSKFSGLNLTVSTQMEYTVTEGVIEFVLPEELSYSVVASVAGTTYTYTGTFISTEVTQDDYGSVIACTALEDWLTGLILSEEAINIRAGTVVAQVLAAIDENPLGWSVFVSGVCEMAQHQAVVEAGALADLLAASPRFSLAQEIEAPQLSNQTLDVVKPVVDGNGNGQSIDI